MTIFFSDDDTGYDNGDVQELVPIGSHDIKATTGEGKLEEMVVWLWSLDVPDEVKMEIEARLREGFRFDPKMFDNCNDCSFAIGEVLDDEESD